METWKTLDDFPGYEVSDLGRIRHKNRGIIKPRLNDKGYLRISLWKKGDGEKDMKVHRLIAMAFLGNPPDGYEINHKDGNRSNNAIDNLEWVTHAENVRHSFEVLGRKRPTPPQNRPWGFAPPRGEKSSGAKLTDVQVVDIRNRYAAKDTSLSTLAKEYGVSKQAIHCIVHRKTWTHI